MYSAVCSLSFSISAQSNKDKILAMSEREFAVSKDKQKDKETLRQLEGKTGKDRGQQADVAIPTDKKTIRQLSSSGEEAKKKRGQ